jgi:hypothetical protein
VNERYQPVAIERSGGALITESRELCIRRNIFDDIAEIIGRYDDLRTKSVYWQRFGVYRDQSDIDLDIATWTS